MNVRAFAAARNIAVCPRCQAVSVSLAPSEVEHCPDFGGSATEETMTSPIPTAASRAAASVGGEGEAAFSPSGMTPGTLGRFSDSERTGVPLQSTWTFWVDRSVSQSDKDDWEVATLP